MKNIYDSGELIEEATCAKIAQVQKEDLAEDDLDKVVKKLETKKKKK